MCCVAIQNTHRPRHTSPPLIALTALTALGGLVGSLSIQRHPYAPNSPDRIDSPGRPRGCPLDLKITPPPSSLTAVTALGLSALVDLAGSLNIQPPSLTAVGGLVGSLWIQNTPLPHTHP